MKDWKIHKKICQCSPVEFEEYCDTVCKLLNGHHNGAIASDYYSRRIVNNQLIWFFHDLEKTIPGSVKDWHTNRTEYQLESVACDPNATMMSLEEFARFYHTGKCSVWTFAIAFAMYSVIKQRKLYMNDQKIVDVWILRTEITKPYLTNVMCYQYPIPSGDDVENWDCDRIHTSDHQLIGLTLEDESLYIVDFAGAQYQVMTRDNNGNFIHVEKVTMTDTDTTHIDDILGDDEIMRHNVTTFSYGQICTADRVYDLFIQRTREQNWTDRRYDLIIDLYRNICKTYNVTCLL